MRFCIFIVATIIHFSGCGSKEAERQRQEKERAEVEEARAAEKGNAVITEMNQHLFGKKAAPTPKDESPIETSGAGKAH